MRVAEGEDTRLIAAGMRIAPSTARTHVQRVLMKLGVGSRLEAAALGGPHGAAGQGVQAGCLTRVRSPAPRGPFTLRSASVPPGSRRALESRLSVMPFV